MTLNRRDFLKTAAAGGALVGLGALAPVTARAAFTRHKCVKPLRILILGGTNFLGPHTVKYARTRGHEVTLFNRGRSNPDLFQDLERLVGDRDGQLEALAGRDWDAVIDTCGYVPRIVTMSADLLRDHVKQYVFISSISVYGDFDEIGLNEDSAVGKLEDETVEDVTAETYGPLKALCEQAAETSMPGRVCNIRPGLIVGSLDRSDRFTYWPVRVSRGGEVLAPHAPGEPTQVIDVRDLAEFIVDSIERNITGVYNAVSPPGEMTMGEMLDTCRRVSGSDAAITWADQDFLAEQDVQAWSDLPCWIPRSMEAGVGTVRVDRALIRGLTFRPLTETIRDTLEWWETLPETRTLNMRAGLSAEREAEVLAAWHAR
ncbi:twin-arginine translocation signal domain-containing protein [bacterium]|nr:twin-arginine translocation signal domain-containing protein [bacterium]MBU1073433.1 twin-arginine translocation signal domain-containing protein [bacterium]MBU1676570.1 twin-arginine translocation signal domain-containing protein [bacterium]